MNARRLAASHRRIAARSKELEPEICAHITDAAMTTHVAASDEIGFTIEATVQSQLQTTVLGNFAMTPQASHAGAALAASRTSDGKLSLGTAENIGAAACAKADGRTVTLQLSNCS